MCWVVLLCHSVFCIVLNYIKYNMKKANNFIANTNVSVAKPDLINSFEVMNKKIGLNNIKVEGLTLIMSNWCNAHIRNLHCKYKDKEWLAICKTEKVSEWVFKVVDMLHPQQKAVGAECETTEDWMFWLMDKLKERNENINEWNLVLHSHHHMGTFRSWTDNNARLWLNDWRTKARAVVTAYDWTPETWTIHYKGCLNFYKPYNIEIDCNVVVEDWNIYEQADAYIHCEQQYEMNVEKYALELFKNKQEEYKEVLDWMLYTPDFNELLEYTWLNIASELKDNYANVVSKRMPNPELEQMLNNLMEQAYQEARDSISKVNRCDMPEQLEEWYMWSNELMEQLEEHIVKPAYTYTYPTTTVGSSVFNSPKYDYTYGYNSNNYKPYNYDYEWMVWYDTTNYPLEQLLREELDIPEDIKLRVNSYTEQWEYLDLFTKKWTSIDDDFYGLEECIDSLNINQIEQWVNI